MNFKVIQNVFKGCKNVFNGIKKRLDGLPKSFNENLNDLTNVKIQSYRIKFCQTKDRPKRPKTKEI